MAYTPTTQVIKNTDGSYTVTTPTGSSSVAGNTVTSTSGAGAYGTPALPPVTPPEDVSKITQIGDITMPDMKSKIGNISTASASTAGSKTRVDELEKQLQEMTTANVGATSSSILNLLQKDRSKTREDMYSELGIDSKDYLSDRKVIISEIDSLSQDYTKKEAEMERRIMEFEKNATGMLQGPLDQRADEIRRSYAIELNAKSAYIKSKSAILQALDGNFQLARDLANDAVNDVVADQKLKMDATLQFYDMYRDVIGTMELPYKRAMEEAVRNEERAYDKSVKDAEFVRDLMLNNTGAKINITDSPQEAYRKYIAAGGDTGGVGGTTTPAGLLQRAIDSGLSAEEAALDVAGFYENTGVQVTEKMINGWMEQARKLTKTVAPVAPTPIKARATAYQTGQNVGTGITPYFEAMQPQNLWGGVQTTLGREGIGGFFSGLFSL